MTTQQQPTTNTTPININGPINGPTTIHINMNVNNKDMVLELIKHHLEANTISSSVSKHVKSITMTKNGLNKNLAEDGKKYMFRNQFLKCVYKKGKPTFHCQHGANITNGHCVTCHPEKYYTHIETCRRSRERKRQARRSQNDDVNNTTN